MHQPEEGRDSPGPGVLWAEDESIAVGKGTEWHTQVQLALGERPHAVTEQDGFSLKNSGVRSWPRKAPRAAVFAPRCLSATLTGWDRVRGGQL